jgi:single-strand DNA-binding protein
MNLVVLVGNLTRDPEVRYTANGNAVANVNIAVNRTFAKEGGPDADFFRVTVFGKQAELVERYLSKGRKVGIEGRIQNDNYEKEGQMIYRDTIIASRIEFLSPKNTNADPFGGEGQSFDRPAQSAAPAPRQEPPSAPSSVPEGFSQLDDDDDDLPF